MFRILSLFVLLSLVNVLGCASKNTIENNPLLQDWTGSYQGLPPFEKIKVEHFKPALEASMAKALIQYQVISENKEGPTFENTMIPMEQASLGLEKVQIIYSIWNSGMSSPELQKVQAEMAPRLAQFNDKIVQNKKLFKRIDFLNKPNIKKSMNSEQQRLVWDYHTSFVKHGAALSDVDKEKVAKINKRHAQLTTTFSQNLLADEGGGYLLLTKKSQLKGLPEGLVTAAEQEAKKRKLKGWVISNTRSSMQPFVTYNADRKLREKAFKIWVSRGEKKNNGVISEILSLRAKRSKIFGYKTYAHWQLSDKMAKDPKNAMKLMLRVWGPAKAQVRKDVVAMQKIVDKEKGGFKIKPWDYRYYAEKLRKLRYDFDMDSVKPYLQLDNVQKAMFWMAGQLYDFNFKKIDNVSVYHKDVTVYEVSKKGKTVGLWYFDPYARQGKRSGAWMNAYRIQSRLLGKTVIPIVSNNSNFIKAKGNEPTLISWDDASTMFHEFGHALHGLSSDVTYPSLAGTNTARDFVEFPSQIHEDWLSTPEVLKFLKK